MIVFRTCCSIFLSLVELATELLTSKEKLGFRKKSVPLNQLLHSRTLADNPRKAASGSTKFAMICHWSTIRSFRISYTRMEMEMRRILRDVSHCCTVPSVHQKLFQVIASALESLSFNNRVTYKAACNPSFETDNFLEGATSVRLLKNLFLLTIPLNLLSD